MNITINTTEHMNENLTSGNMDGLLSILRSLVANNEDACDEELENIENLLYEVECNEIYSQDGFSYSIEFSDGNEDAKVMLIRINNNYNNTSGYISCLANVDSCGGTTWESWKYSTGNLDITI